MIEPVAFLHEHAIQRAHTADTLRTYTEILYDWFDTLEQNDIPWHKADVVDLVAYRNRMMSQPSPHTGRAYRTTTINHRVRGVLRFYVLGGPRALAERIGARGQDPRLRCVEASPPIRTRYAPDTERSIFVLRQYEPLPRPLVSGQARELLAYLAPPYDLMARWQLYTGLRISELLRLGVDDINGRPPPLTAHHTIEITRKGRKPGYVIAPASLLDETDGYIWASLRVVRARDAGDAPPTTRRCSSTPAAHR